MGRLRARVPDDTAAMDLADTLGGDPRVSPRGEARKKNVTFTDITYVGVGNGVGSTTAVAKDEAMGGLSANSSSTPATTAAPRSGHPHPDDRQEVAAFPLHEGFAATRRNSSGGRRSKIVSSLRPNNTASTNAGAGGGGGGATWAGGGGGNKSSSPPPPVISVHDPTHRRHWQKMKHVALADKHRTVPPTVAVRRAASAQGTRHPSSSAPTAASSVRNVLDASLASPPDVSSPPTAEAAATTAAATAAQEAGEAAAPATPLSSMRSPSFRFRRGGRSSSIGGGSIRLGGGAGGGGEEDSRERAIAIGSQDAELIAWLNSVLFFSVGGAAATTPAGDDLDDFAAKHKQIG